MPVVSPPLPPTKPSLPPPTPLAVPPAEAARLLSLSVSRIYQLMRKGELQSYGDGRTRRIITASLHAYIARRLAVAEEAGGWVQWKPRARRRWGRTDRPQAG